MKIAPDLMYATKVWLFSVFASPLILSAYIIYDSAIRSLADAVSFIGVFAILGLIFSVPSWILFMIGVRNHKRIAIIADSPKTNIQIMAVILCTLPFLFLFGGILGNPEVMLFAIPYLITLSIGIWYFELKPTVQNETLIIDHLVE